MNTLTLAPDNEVLLPIGKKVLRHIPSLDGLRGVSILLVLLGHGIESIPLQGVRLDWLWIVLNNAHLGVMVFFVISGYLITYLLRCELEKAGTINLRAFYLRRSLRIFPAFYAFLLVAGLLIALKIVPSSLTDLTLAGTYLWNYRPFTSAWNPIATYGGHEPQSWYLGHLWSLSLEEQFYLLWAPLLACLGLGRSLKTAVAIILAEPFLRLATYFVFPSLRSSSMIMLPWALDPLMFGAAAAICQGNPRFEAAWKRMSVGWIPAAAAIFLLAISPLLSWRLKGTYNVFLAPTLQSLAILLILLWLVRRPGTSVGRVFNVPAFAAIGKLSYSLYLWQQLFLVPWSEHRWILQQFPINVFACFVAAVLSYYVIEQPFLRLKSRFTRVPVA